MLSLVNWRIKVTISDGRALTGQMLAFDKHMNLVLAECEEFRRIRPKKKPGETEAGPEQEMKRTLGLVILRGESVVSLTVEGPPPVQDDDKAKNIVRLSPPSFFFFFARRAALLSCTSAASGRPRTRYARWARDGHDAPECVAWALVRVRDADQARSLQWARPACLVARPCHSRRPACPVRRPASARPASRLAHPSRRQASAGPRQGACLSRRRATPRRD
jgi:small nuclear ribonucleoprotein (snRNP)-like protein